LHPSYSLLFIIVIVRVCKVTLEGCFYLGGHFSVDNSRYQQWMIKNNFRSHPFSDQVSGGLVSIMSTILNICRYTDISTEIPIF